MTQPAPPVFMDLTVSNSLAESHELTHMSLSGATPEFLAGYQTPGQYVQVRTGGLKPGFFAISSAPGRSQIDLLIKRGSPLADAIVSTPAGGTLQVSPPAGRGYPFEQARGRNLLVIGVGSGIAPLRAVIQSIIDKRDDYGAVSFIYGARTPASIPYKAEMDAWQKREIEVTRVCSQPGEGTWSGPLGRVHDVLVQKHAQLDPRCAAFVCGMKAMVEDVKSTLGNLGLPPERVFQNF